MSSKSIITSQHFQCNTDCFNLPQTHYLTFTHTEFLLYQHTLNNKGSFSISSPTFIFTGKQKICTKGNRKISTSLPHCHLTHENSRQTCLAVQLNHILSHSVNRKKPIQNHWQSHKKKKRPAKGHRLCNATSIGLHPLYNVLFGNTSIHKKPLFHSRAPRTLLDSYRFIRF